MRLRLEIMTLKNNVRKKSAGNLEYVKLFRR